MALLEAKLDMIAIEYRINGRRTTLQSAESRIEAAMLRRVEMEIQQKLGAVWCPHHQQWPRILVVGRSADELEFQVGACCPSLKDRAAQALRSARRN